MLSSRNSAAKLHLSFQVTKQSADYIIFYD